MNKANTSLMLSIIALCVALYGTLFQPKARIGNKEISLPQTNGVHTEVNKEQEPDFQEIKLITLQKQITLLENRVAQFNTSSDDEQPFTHERFKEAVLDVIAFKEQQDRQELKEQDPLYSFHEDLPKDYEMRVKTEPDYANQVSKELRQKVLDESLPEVERIAAMSQLQMTMFMLNKSNMPEYDYETVDAILAISRNANDEKLKVLALETVAFAPIADKRISDSFVAMIEKEPNDYVRSLVANGLISQYYLAQENQSEFRKHVAQDILGLYDNASDQSLKDLLGNQLDDERMLAEIRKHAYQ